MGLLQDANQSIGEQSTGRGLLQQSGFSSIREVTTTKRTAKAPTFTPSKTTKKNEKTTYQKPSKPSLLSNIGKSILGGAKQLPGQITQAGGILIGDMSRRIRSIENFFQSKIGQSVAKSSSTYNIASGAFNLVEKIKPKETKVLSNIGKVTKNEVIKNLETQGKTIREKGQASQQRELEDFSKDFVQSEGLAGFVEMAAFNLPQIATTTALTLGTGILTKSPTLATTVGLSTSYGLGASEVYSEARRGGLNDSQALPLAQAGGLLIGAIDFIPLNRLLRKSGVAEPIQKQITKSIVKKIASNVVSVGTQAGFEGLTESIQEIVGNAFKSTYTENQDLLEGVKEAFFVGALLGGFSDVTLSGIMSATGAKNEESFTSEVENRINNILDKTETTRTKEEQEVVNNLLERTMSPEEAISFTVESDLDNTNLGKQIVLASMEAKDSGKFVKIVQKENSDDIDIEIVDVFSETEISDEVFDSLLRSEEVDKVESQDTPQTKEARKEIRMTEEQIQEARDENESKKQILEQFTPDQVKAMRSIQRSVQVLENKGQDPTSVSGLKSYQRHIEDIMSIIGTKSEDEALRFIREDLPDPVTPATSREEQRKMRYLKSKIKPKEVGVPRSQLPVQGQPLTDNERINIYEREFGGQLLNVDDVREMYKPDGYNRTNSAEFHERASNLAQKIFDKQLSQIQKGDKYMFTAGSSGSGKSSSLGLYPQMSSDVKFGLDSNFSSQSALDKLDKVMEKGADVQIVFVYREPLDAWNNGVLRRVKDPKNGRVVPAEIFFENLNDSPTKVLEAFKKYEGRISIKAIDNSKGKGKASVVDNPIEFLEQISYNMSDVRKQVIKSTKEQIQSGEISKEAGKALLGSDNTKNGSISEQGSKRRVSSPVTSKPGKLKASRLESRIRGLLDKASPEVIEDLGLASYRQLNKKQTISKAIAYVEENPNEAMKVLTGQIEAPEGILKNAIYIAMEQTAKGDVNLARKLASLQSTRFGQEISILTELDPDSPVKMIEDVYKIREQEFNKRFKNTTVKKAQKKVAEQIKSKVKKPDKFEWNSFINSIEC